MKVFRKMEQGVAAIFVTSEKAATSQKIFFKLNCKYNKDEVDPKVEWMQSI